MDVILGSSAIADCRLDTRAWSAPYSTGSGVDYGLIGLPQSTLTGLSVLAKRPATSRYFLLLQSEVWDECGVSSKIQDPQRAFPTPWSWFIGVF